MNVTVVGGCEFQVAPGSAAILTFGAHRLLVTAADGRVLDELPESELIDIEIGGPGQVTSGGGYVGGGFGVAGFLAGAAAASVMNDLTTKSSIVTSLAVFARTGELHALLSDTERARVDRNRCLRRPCRRRRVDVRRLPASLTPDSSE